VEDDRHTSEFELDDARWASMPRLAEAEQEGTLTVGEGVMLRRNDPGQYDLLADTWWDLRGPFAMLHWIAQARASLVPPATRPGSVLVDVACGGGLLAPHIRHLGYVHIGVDLSPTAVRVAREHGLRVVQGDAARLPLADSSVDVVVAGECLEHVHDLKGVVGELCRILKPGGTLVVDTIASTALARFLAITVAERLPGGPPPGLHDGDLFVDPDALTAACAAGGVDLRLNGLRPALLASLAWLSGRRSVSRMVRTPSTAVLFQGTGAKSKEREE
jgi:2-polyprenyl-6-hydroxyphenyl methylase/3-demethylubiquinone-9 3-methyltransferase